MFENQDIMYEASGTVVEPNASNEKLNIGINNSQTLDYGEIPAKVGITKTLQLQTPRRAVVEVEVTGNISDKLEYEEEAVFVGRKDWDFRFSSEETGYYEGNVTLNSRIARNRWGAKWINATQSQE